MTVFALAVSMPAYDVNSLTWTCVEKCSWTTSENLLGDILSHSTE